MTVYRTTEDIVIPAGTYINLEPPAYRFYATSYVSVPITVQTGTAVEGSEWLMDLQEGLESGLIEEVPEDPEAA